MHCCTVLYPCTVHLIPYSDAALAVFFLPFTTYTAVFYRVYHVVYPGWSLLPTSIFSSSNTLHCPTPKSTPMDISRRHFSNHTPLGVMRYIPWNMTTTLMEHRVLFQHLLLELCSPSVFADTVHVYNHSRDHCSWYCVPHVMTDWLTHLLNGAPYGVVPLCELARLGRVRVPRGERLQHTAPRHQRLVTYVRKRDVMGNRR